jgi:hypothetical protein
MAGPQGENMALLQYWIAENPVQQTVSPSDALFRQYSDHISATLLLLQSSIHQQIGKKTIEIDSKEAQIRLLNSQCGPLAAKLKIARERFKYLDTEDLEALPDVRG